MPKAFNFGRIFFPGKPQPIPDEVRLQPLGNHVGNVVELVEAWRQDDFPAAGSQERVKEAAKIHDMGKPKHFEINSETDHDGKFKKYIYSFKGHRFDARSDDLWTELLGIGHHDFSVADISRDTYKLKKELCYANSLLQEPLAYARELYILEMCDQIEAELACRVLGDDEQAESRTFMEFTITKDTNNSNTYLIDPWPFDKDSLSLTFRYWLVQPKNLDQSGELQKCLEQKRAFDLGKTLDRLVKTWWKDQKNPTEASSVTISLKPYHSNEQDKLWTVEDFYNQLAGFQPNEMQVEMFNAIYDRNYAKHPAILLKASTGTGKTESVLFPALASGYRLFLPLPARSLLDDQKERIARYIQRFSQINPEREFSLVVDTGSQMYRWIYQNGQEVKRNTNPRRHLYKGDVILTTIDKFLYRYFAFGDKQKSFIFPLRINDKRTLICFDEAHTYDNISFTNFQNLVQSLYEAGRALVLMTATMPPRLTEYFDYLELFDFSKSSQPTPKILEWRSSISCRREDVTAFQEEFTDVVLQEWRTNEQGRRILAVVETVRDAAAIYQKLREQLTTYASGSEPFLFLYHGRIADQLRPDIYEKIKKRDRDGKPYILVTTSAIEVGCDLNAEVLVSQICPPENLIQRAGRCNRRGNVNDAKVIVLGDSIPDFANSLDEMGWQTYQKTLKELTTNKLGFDTEKISACISDRQHIDDYRVVELFSMLHDYVYAADLTCKPAHEKGLIPTRSWEPSVELRYVFKDEKHHSISVPISRLAQKDGKQYAYVYAFERRYDKENTRWHEVLLDWGSAYSKDIIVQISGNLGEFIFDTSLPEYDYEPELGFVELPKVFSAKWNDGADVKLKYEIEKSDKSKHVSIIFYTNSIRDR